MSVHFGGRGPGHLARNQSGSSPPALSINFTTGALDARITFARASSATRTNSSGVIESVSSNTARFDYDPSTLAAKGLLIEEARTNLFLNSTIDGANLATQNVTVTAQAYTISFYGTGTIELSGAHTASVVGTGAYPSRKTLTFTPSAGTLTCTVTGTVQYAQIEAGSFASSYIPTAGATVTRAADVATMTGTNFSSWYNQSEGTFVVDYQSFSNGTGANPYVYGAYTTGLGAFAGVRLATSQYNTSAGLMAISPTIANTNSNTIGIAYKAGASQTATSVNGGAVTTGTLTPPTVNVLAIGGLEGAIYYFSGHILTLSYYNTRKANADLQALTA